MKKNCDKYISKILAVAICGVLLFASAMPCFASEADAVSADKESETIKVGFFAFDGYHMQKGNDKDGYVRSGYGYEMLMHLAGYGGFNYEFVGYDKSWDQMQNMLEKGEIDILTSAQQTPEREARFDFSDINIGVSSAILTVKAGDEKYSEADCDNWDGIRVGMIEGNSRNDSLAKYAKENEFSFEPVYFESTDAMVSELQSDKANKKIDAILTSDLRKTKNEWVIAEFDASPFFIMVQKGNTKLLKGINAAISELDVCEPGIRTKLKNKYYTSDGNEIVSFNREERAFIKKMQNQQLTAAINPDRAPYSYYKDGKLTGETYDVANKIIERTGLNIKFAKLEEPKAYYKAVDDGNIDIRFEIFSSYNEAEKENLWITTPFMPVTMTKLHNEETKHFRTAAEPNNRDIAEDYEELLREMGQELVVYPTIKKSVDAVLSGKCDVAYLPVDTSILAVRNDVTNKLTWDEIFGQDTNYAVAVSDSQDPLLFSIMNKAAASISENDINTTRQSYASNLEKPSTLRGLFYDYPIQSLIVAAGILGIVILIIILMFQAKRRRREQEFLKKEQEQNEILKGALASAEKADKAKSQFLSSVSHEMRTPLNAIIGFIELSKGASAEKQASYLAGSDIAAKQLLNVINDVLDMSSIESGKLKLANANFNLKHLISSVTNIFGTQCKQKGIDFETKITTPINEWLVGDELRLNQILMNLLGNAVKFTSSGHIWLTVSETNVNDKKTFLRFTVTDTGCGMSDEMKERLFKPFEQENASVAKKYGGSGLGLSIVKNLVAMMGGTIKVESKQGVGTTFIVDLPFDNSNTVEITNLPDNIESLRILAVDDEESEREYISLVLKRMGLRFTCADNGHTALACLESAEEKGDPYNVCLIDWKMSGMSGVETTAKIREKYGKDVVVIVVSAYDFQQAGESAKEAGANLFLSKPVFQSSLFDLFMTLTGGEIAKSEKETHEWDFSGKRVLLVEDNVLNQVIAQGQLGKFNLVVELAENGKEAVEMFNASEKGYYDAILMDIQMPVMDGFEATKEIRLSTHPNAKTVQIIAQTADAFTEDIGRCLSAGMDAHVSKPISPDNLARALHKAFTDKT